MMRSAGLEPTSPNDAAAVAEAMGAASLRTPAGVAQGRLSWARSLVEAMSHSAAVDQALPAAPLARRLWSTISRAISFGQGDRN